MRTDLALEEVEVYGEKMTSAVNKQTQTQKGILIVSVDISSPEAAKLLNKPCGRYLTLHMPHFKSLNADFFSQAEVVAQQLSEILPENKNGALVVGLGNSEITPDALGPKAVSYLFATRHIDDDLKKSIGMGGICSVCAIAPGVLGQTGIETGEIIASLTARLKPSMVIVIDALAAKSIDRLGQTIQISNTGISPGSGVQNKRSEISSKTLGVPVISIGVPTVVDMATVAEELFNKKPESAGVGEEKSMMVTPREIDLVIEHAAKMVSLAINKALQPSLSMQEITSLVG